MLNLSHLGSTTDSTAAERYQQLQPSQVADGSTWFNNPPGRHLSYTREPPKSIFHDATARLPPAVSEAAVQQTWNDQYIKRLESARRIRDNPRQTVVLVDTHTQRSLGNSKPDMIGYLPQAPQQVFNIYLIGENKPRRGSNEGTFTNQEKGQLVGYLKKLLSMLPHRPFAIGFLTDGVLIQFFKLHAGTNTIPMKLIETPTTTLDGKLFF